MTRVWVTLLAALVPVTASAQTAPNARRLAIGAIVGAAVVQNVGGALGGEISFTLTDSLDVFAEGIAMQDVVTRRRLNLVPIVTNFLQSSQGKTATGDLTAPAGYGGAGVRFALTKGKIQPYVAFSAGAATVTLMPVFTLGGIDVTTTLSQYGVQIGSDLTGESTSAAFGGGAGVRMTGPRMWTAASG